MRARIPHEQGLDGVTPTTQPSTKRFAGRRVLVTGASRGIGAGIAQRLAAEGADVAITARTLGEGGALPGSLHETAARMAGYGGKVIVIVADLLNEDDRTRIVTEAEAGLGGHVEILINNAAAAIYQPLAEYSLKRRRLNVSSATARLTPGPPFDTGPHGATLAMYGASKAALNRMTNGLAVELFGTGIRVNTIEPRAAVLTEGADALVGSTLRADQIESLEQMVEGVLAVCDCRPDFTGQIAVSLDLISSLHLVVRALDGGS
jgi:citronellol/citronellal dehydrogenase